MKCVWCNELNVGPEHDIMEKHLRNRMLFEYSKNRKQFAGNKKGILVYCNVHTTFTTLEECSDAKIKVSAKPNEDVKFNFIIRNDCNKEDVVVVFIQMLNSKLNFTTDAGMEFGCKQVVMKPKAVMKKQVSFKCADIGQYELPIIFSFRKPGTNESFLIARDMDSFTPWSTLANILTLLGLGIIVYYLLAYKKSEKELDLWGSLSTFPLFFGTTLFALTAVGVVVFVEEQLKVHKKEISPYKQQEVKADRLVQSTMHNDHRDVYTVPKKYMGVYASDLKVKETSPKEEKEFIEDIREVFKTGLTKDNYVRFFHNLLWYEETIVRINLKKYNMSDVTLCALETVKDSYSLVVPGLSEKRPPLMIGSDLFVKPQGSDEQMFRGKITDIQDDVAIIKGLDHSFKQYYRRDAQFHIRFLPSRTSLERMHQAVNGISNSEPKMCRVFPEENTHITPVERLENFYNPLVEKNIEQRTGVEHIVAGTSGLAPFLLHGPPGTGKTATIVEAILQLVAKSSKNRIMVCTDSNMAADHVATMLIKYSDMFPEDKFLLRASSKSRVWETLPESLVKHSNGSSKDNFERIPIKEFMSFNIVVTTLSHAALFAKLVSHENLVHPITHLFIDEASQASEPACLIPTCGLLKPTGSLVLAGDPLQLGPVVISQNARKIGLGLSLMERLKHTCSLYSSERNDPNYLVMLKNNFRSNSDILEIPNDLFYNKQLRALASQDPLSSTDILGERTHSRAIVFHGVISKEQRMGKSPSFFNSMEVEIVQRYIKCLITIHKVLPEDIGVVAPYIRQVYKIKNWLNDQNFGAGKIEVGTVEAFQGKEKRVIIISTVRANANLLDCDAKFKLGFLVDDKRFNVALTRAKAKAIVIGNPLCLQKDAKWRAYIEKCRQFGTYFGYQVETNNEIQKDLDQTISSLMEELKIKN